MNPRYTIRNFRVFDEKGATIELAPVTLLTGCNSSGKSSITKSILVLNNYLEKIRKDFFQPEENNGFRRGGKHDVNYSEHTINFLDDNLKSLGRFDKILNESTSDSSISFEYTVHSPQLMMDVNVQYQFVADEENGIANGLFKELKITDKNDNIIYCYSKDSYIHDYYSLKDSFFKHCYIIGVPQGLIKALDQLDWDYESGKKNAETVKQDKVKLFEVFKKWRDNQDANDFIDAVSSYSCENTIFSESYYSFSHNDSNEKYYEWRQNVFSKAANGNKIICNLPILNEFTDLPKYAVRLKFEDYLLRINLDDTEKECLEWMLNDFESSAFDSFIDYYRAKEEDMFRSCKTGLSASFKGMIGEGLYRSPLYWNYGDAIDVFTGEIIPSTEQDLINRDPELWKKQGVRFPWMYELLCSLSDELHIPTDGYYQKNQVYKNIFGVIDELKYDPNGFYSNIMGEAFFDYVYQALRSVICPDLLQGLKYVTSSVAIVKRLYDINSKDDFSVLLKEYIQPDKVQNDDNRSSEFVSHWLKTFGIGEYLSFVSDKEGAGVNIYLHRDENDKEGRLLADEGYGYTHLISLLIQIECIIRKESALIQNHALTLDAFHWVKENRGKKKPQFIIVEEPENHLHPNLQSQLADMFLDAYKKHGIHFLVETHSEYLIRRSQVLVAEMCKEKGLKEQEDVDSNNPFRTFYVPKGGCTYDLQYSNNGKFIQLFGEGFCDEADKWSIRLFDLENE